MFADLIRIEEDFWKNHVQARILPDPDGSKLADRVIAEYFRKSVPGKILLTGFNEKLDRRQELSEMMAEMDAEKRLIEQELKLYLGETESAENEQYRVSWKSVSSSRIDEKRLKEEKPEVYKQYQKIVESRRFTVKAA